MKAITQCKQLLALIIAVGFMALAPAAWAGTTVTYTGQGFFYDGTTYNLNDERCGLTGQNDANDGGTGQFADWNGPDQPYETGQGYLVWVLTANGATSAKLNLPDGTVDMIKVGGTFKYASQYYNASLLIGPPAVTAEYEGTARGNVQLVVSHGCQPFETEGAWCSPGYWGNAQDAAWDLINRERTDYWNQTVFLGFVAGSDVLGFFSTMSGLHADPQLGQGGSLAERFGVLGNQPTYSGAPLGTFSFGGSTPFAMNAFNATGAYLTSLIPGFHFDPDLIGEENACPIDNHGNFK
ncbi:hypothetical protein [Nitrosomonas sp. ANs5]|uniref:hypothetical protein n=1 Tax=Nitrosomonas sp. ANs5 TaxID=3423941 RepID=UPI003D33BADC